jgi:hypothetical protein
MGKLGSWVVVAAILALVICAAQISRAQQPVIVQPSVTPTPEEKPPDIKPMTPTDTKVFFKILPKNFKLPEDHAGKLLLKEYGAVFAAAGGAVPPNKIIFRDEFEVTEFQDSVEKRTEIIGDMSMTLQAPAMTALLTAIGEAQLQGLSITPRDTDSASRSYFESVSLWLSRVEPALKHWIGKKRLTAEDATRIRALPLDQQVAEILRLEQSGIYFARDLSKSIIYSVAPPGTSQHLSMLAFDVKEYENLRVRSIMERNGWFQTVISDLPHFTFLGLPEIQLPSRGLKSVQRNGHKYWVPDIP